MKKRMAPTTFAIHAPLLLLLALLVTTVAAEASEIHAAAKNGHINPKELADQRVTVFVTHEHRDHYDTTIFDWQNGLDDITYVYGFRPERLPQNRQTGYHGPAYEYIGPREHKDINCLDVTTIAANDAGVGYLIRVDGLTLYHAGDHAGWAPNRREGYIAEIDFLDEQVDELDLAFVNVTGCHTHDTAALAEGTWYTLEHLRPAAWFPTHAAGREYIYGQFAHKAQNHPYGERIACPENRGDKFLYKMGRIL